MARLCGNWQSMQACLCSGEQHATLVECGSCLVCGQSSSSPLQYGDLSITRMEFMGELIKGYAGK